MSSVAGLEKIMGFDRNSYNWKTPTGSADWQIPVAQDKWTLLSNDKKR